MTTSEIYARAGWGASVERGSRPGVLVVDLTRGFTEPQFEAGTDLSSTVEATNVVVAAAREVGAPVFWTRIAYSPGELEPGVITWLTKATGMRALVEGSVGATMDPRVAVHERDVVLTKKGASAFWGTGLQQLLTASRVDTLIVCGATTSGCVRASVVDGVQSGLSVLVPREAVGDRAEEPHEANLFDMQAKYADVVGVDDVTSWLRGLGR